VIERDHDHAADHARGDVVDHDAEAAGEVLIEPADRRRFRDVERPEHDESDGKRRPARTVDGGDCHQVPGDLVDDDAAAVVRAPRPVRPIGRPDPDRDDPGDHDRELPPWQPRERPGQRNGDQGAAGPGSNRRVAGAAGRCDPLRDCIHRSKHNADPCDFSEMSG
jgi:hypothetical protein